MTGPDFNLSGKVALLTGAGRGIGLGIAKALAAHGAAVAIQDVDVDVAAAEAEAILTAGGRAVAIGGDVTDLGLAGRVVKETVQQLGGLHVLVNNAAIQKPVHWLDQPPEEMATYLTTNVVGPIAFCQHAVPVLRQQRWGRIVNIGSIQGAGGNAAMLPYSLSKAALVTLTKALARDLAKDNVTVNLISPGWINTYRNRDDFPTEQVKEDKGRHVPLGRVGEPADFGGVAVLLCSDAGAYITGQVIGVDGGMSAR
ncbi:MAG TPA: SDR family NAD(P)-dependent oxidoreductase [Tepidisphaeraceae bacterium]|nr:SDR family NAD(P)-dependent oxidoreductase [Tepidisphaeraceae bacterium]